MKTVTYVIAIVLGLFPFLIAETTCDSSTVSDSLHAARGSVSENTTPLTPEEFIRHYADLAIIRYTFPDDSTGQAEALARYFEKTGVTREKMNSFVSRHTDDMLFWKNTWEKIESDLKRRLDTPGDDD